VVEEDCVSLGEWCEARRRSVLRHMTLATNLIRYYPWGAVVSSLLDCIALEPAQDFNGLPFTTQPI